MFNHLLHPIEELLRQYPENSRFLLALSGGSDSSAMLHALLTLQKKYSFSLGAAHVDHGWRCESHQEAALVQQRMESLGIPYFHASLKGKKLNGNLESACRDERLQFFLKICHTENYQAVLLAHHQDDLVETVLKRILEGASLSNLIGMEEMAKWNEMDVLRPWLRVSKSQILAYNQSFNVPFFTDPTNLSTKFLRGRMRKEIIPDLESQFGKSIRNPLTRLSLESQELNAFMKKKWVSSPWKQAYIDFREIESPFEMRWLIKQWVKWHKLELSWDAIESMIQLLLQGLAGRKFELKEHRIEVDRQKIFLVDKFKNSGDEPLLLKEGIYTWGEWEIEVRQKFEADKENVGWKAAFSGPLTAFLPAGDCYLIPYEHLKDKKRLNKKWSDEKVPAFLRTLLPVVMCNGEIVQEFLLEKRGRSCGFLRMIQINQRKPLYLE